jgi:O-antigen ligase
MRQITTIDTKTMGDSPGIQPLQLNSQHVFDFAGQIKLPTQRGLQTSLYVVFGILLLLVAVLCVFTSPLLPVALVAALIVAVSGIIYPPFALFLIFMGAGLPTLLLSIPGHTMRPIEPAIFLCLLIVLVRRPFFRLRLPHRLALLFLVFTLISFIHVPDISTNVDAYAADKRLFGVLLACLAFFCGTALIGYVKNISGFLVAVLLSNFPVFLIAFAQAIHLHVPALWQAPGAQDPKLSDGRLWGPFPGAAVFGLYLTNLFAVALAVWILGNSRRDRVIGAIMTVATLLVLLGTGTRSAAAAAVVLLFFTLVLTRRYKLLAGLTVLACIGAGVFFDKILPKFMHPLSSTTNRLFLWGEALKLIRANPWIGIGMEQFHVYYERLIISQADRLNSHGISVHNQYLELAMESGIIHLIVTVSLLLSILACCWFAYHSAQQEQRVLFLAAMLAVLVTMMVGLFLIPLDQAEGTVFLFLLTGLATGYAERLRREKKVRETGSRVHLSSRSQ